jgi:hypothetical protein
MATKILEISTESAIPEFVPFGVVYYAKDTGFLWLGTGSSAPGANVVLVDSPPGGFGSGGVGDIQYNNGGELGGSAATITAAGAINIPAGQQITATIFTVAASGAAPTSAGTAGTIGQIIMFGGNLYMCSQTGAAGSALWWIMNRTAV